MKARIKEIDYIDKKRGYKVGDIIEVQDEVREGYYKIIGTSHIVFKFQCEIIDESEEEAPLKDEHYNNENGSLYLFAQHHGLNAYEFDILKRVVRCRKKGQFISDLEKTKRVIDLYLKEQSSNQ